MDGLDVMKLFVRVVERRSFTQAANDMEVPRSTCTEVIRGLEIRLDWAAREFALRHLPMREH